MGTKKAKSTSLRAYAKRRGVSAEAVSKAITAGRLRECVVFVDGAPKIGDVEVADREWAENTRPRIDNARPEMSPGEAIAKYNVSRALREAAAARREAALADMAELDASEKKGEFVPVKEAKADVIALLTAVKTRILGVPTRLAQQLPHLAAEVVPLIDALLREALVELAAERGDDDEPEE